MSGRDEQGITGGHFAFRLYSSGGGKRSAVLDGAGEISRYLPDPAGHHYAGCGKGECLPWKG